jgi:hypothetical protein
MKNAGMIAEIMSEMDFYLRKTGERKLMQLKFGEIINKFTTKDDLYK